MPSSVVTGKTALRESQVSETSGEVWIKEDLLPVEKDHTTEHLNKRSIHKFVRFNEIQPQVLRELFYVLERPLLITFERP